MYFSIIFIKWIKIFNQRLVKVQLKENKMICGTMNIKRLATFIIKGLNILQIVVIYVSYPFSNI